MDERIAVWSATHRVGFLDDPSVWLGTIEKLGAVWIVLAVALGLLQRRGPRWTVGIAVLTAVATFVADSLALGVKDLTNRPRPFEAHPQIHPLYVVHSSSFPAGHAATAFAGAALLSFAAPELWPLFAALAGAVAFSRVYVGVHYPTDVIAGAVIGCLVAAVVVAALAFLGRRRPKWRLRTQNRRRPVVPVM